MGVLEGSVLLERFVNDAETTRERQLSNLTSFALLSIRRTRPNPNSQPGNLDPQLLQQPSSQSPLPSPNSLTPACRSTKTVVSTLLTFVDSSVPPGNEVYPSRHSLLLPFYAGTEEKPRKCVETLWRELQGLERLLVRGEDWCQGVDLGFPRRDEEECSLECLAECVIEWRKKRKGSNFAYGSSGLQASASASILAPSFSFFLLTFGEKTGVCRAQGGRSASLP